MKTTTLGATAPDDDDSGTEVVQSSSSGNDNTKDQVPAQQSTSTPSQSAQQSSPSQSCNDQDQQDNSKSPAPVQQQQQSSSNDICSQPQTPNTIAQYNINWFNTSFQCNDIGVGSEGDVYVVGLDGKLYEYNFLLNTYALVEADFEMNQISRVDVDDDGTPYVISNCGQIYYLNCFNHWVQLPGCGTDIGLGRGNDAWKIGCDARAGGFGIWKLFCKEKNKCDSERRCTRWRNDKYTINMGRGDRKKCYWYRVEGGAARVDVHPDGNPWVATNAGYIYGYDSVNWHLMDGIIGMDLSVSNEGMVFVAGTDQSIWVLENLETMTWANIGDNAKAVSVGPYSQPWVVGGDQNVYSTSKMGYN